ncbi:DNA sulfur modification protein DndB [Burkholderia ubonensis]|uniref:DNA sulfur modification protein DndB n=1 Tax=Burkholderia ubonensis TaxID=101571 RepID=UPI0012F961D3|nr:DNA sulfur modification protein DndB [Burkholderia ubonensis]
MENMFGETEEVFDQKFRGSFGRFGTSGSNQAYYFLTTIPIKNLKHRLQVAADALPINKIEFSQMIQRDVNAGHVADIKKYLVEGSGKAVFFPPLLVSIINKDKNGGVQEWFENNPSRTESGNSTTITWDSSLFRVKLYAPPEQNDKHRRLLGIGDPYQFFDFGAHLELNSSRSGLVVIDGQHRYKALSSLYESEDFKNTVEGIEIPICIVFSPFAVGHEKSGLEDLRDIFVTVNNEAKLVSGHFRDLLDDYSYASEAIRQVAQSLKSDVGGGYSLLHHLEWNTHDPKKAGQINRPYSITSVSIIVEALRSSLFVKRTAADVLQLTAVQEQLSQVDPDLDIDELNDSVSPTAKEILSNQIEKHVARSLKVIFTEFAPFAMTISEMQIRMKALAADFARGEHSHLVTLYGLFDKHQIPSDTKEIEPSTVRTAYNEFVTGIDEKQVESASHTKLAVFHQALIRAWVHVSQELMRIDILPFEAAYILIRALEATVLTNKMQFISNSAYTQTVIWNGDRVNFKPEWAKTAWTNLLLCTLSQKQAVDAAINALVRVREKDEREVDEKLKKSLTKALQTISIDSASEYLSELDSQVKKFYRAHYAEILQDESVIDHLHRLKRSSRPEDKEKFEQSIAKEAFVRYSEGQSKLLAIIKVDPDSLQLS